MIITVDTNVLFQALDSRNGASFFIFNLIRQKQLGLAISISVFEEYSDVLLRQSSLEKFGMSQADVEQFLTFITFIGKPQDIYFKWRPNLRDENDNLFIELAVASQSKWLITNNKRDFLIGNELNFDEITIATPKQFVTEWKKTNE